MAFHYATNANRLSHLGNSLPEGVGGEGGGCGGGRLSWACMQPGNNMARQLSTKVLSAHANRSTSVHHVHLCVCVCASVNVCVCVRTHRHTLTLDQALDAMQTTYAQYKLS